MSIYTTRWGAQWMRHDGDVLAGRQEYEWADDTEHGNVAISTSPRRWDPPHLRLDVASLERVSVEGAPWRDVLYEVSLHLSPSDARELGEQLAKWADYLEDNDG